MYSNFFKRLIDFTLSLCALVVLSPVLLVLAIIGTVAMRGNPFFTQQRPGKINRKTGTERIFKLVKFRTMSNAKDKDGNLLPDEARLNAYGRFLRSTSLDELPEFWNILKGDMAMVGPRPLLVAYLPLYSMEQRRRHEVRPGLTGYAQVYSHNCMSWQEKFEKDVYYVDRMCLKMDIQIIFKTIPVVLKQKRISSNSATTTEAFAGNDREEAK